MKTGLVLEGGGVRGIYTAGVLDVFLEQGISFDGVIGVSAGAIHSCSYLSGQRGRSIRYYRNYCSDPRFMSFSSLIKTGDLVGEEFCYHEIPEKLDIYDNEAFLACGVPFWAVCSNLHTGKPEYLRITDMNAQIDILRASASMPYVSRPVTIDGRLYLDGGCTDSIPIRAFREMGFERNVVVLTRDADYRKKRELPGLAKAFYRRYPVFARAQSRRHEDYNRTLEEIRRLEEEGSIFVIRPQEPPNIGRMETDPEKVQRVYDMGRRDAEAAMDGLKAWLAAGKPKQSGFRISVCLDDNNGMRFNNRRQSRDSAVLEDIAAGTEGPVYIDSCSQSLLDQAGIPHAPAPERFPDGFEGHFFLEGRPAEEGLLRKADTLVIYRWNRHYPADMRWDADPEKLGFALTQTREFAGSSHPRITKEVYTR